MPNRTKYDETVPKQLEDHMSEGLSFASFAGVVGVTEQTLLNWRKRHPDFQEAYELGRAASMLFWERLGIQGCMGVVENFNTGAWIFNMKNRFQWRDRQEHAHIHSLEAVQKLPDDVLEAQVTQILEQRRERDLLPSVIDVEADHIA